MTEAAKQQIDFSHYVRGGYLDTIAGIVGGGGANSIGIKPGKAATTAITNSLKSCKEKNNPASEKELAQAWHLSAKLEHVTGAPVDAAARAKIEEALESGAIQGEQKNRLCLFRA